MIPSTRTNSNTYMTAIRTLTISMTVSYGPLRHITPSKYDIFGQGSHAVWSPKPS